MFFRALFFEYLLNGGHLWPLFQGSSLTYWQTAFICIFHLLRDTDELESY